MNISQGKWSRAWLDNPPGPSTNKGTGINWPMMRYADVLLMHAEAENELNGPTTLAKEALRRVRQRAFNKTFWNEKVEQYIAGISTDKTKFFNAIVNERAWEFGGEFTRKYDLIRWNIYASKMAETVAGLKKMTDDAVNGTGSLPDYLYVKLDSKGNLIFYNLFRKVTAAPDESWIRKSWLIDMSNPTTTYDEWMTKDWARYTHPVRYIFPIPTVGIDNSKGILKNDGYGF
jgi:hypothetical protein